MGGDQWEYPGDLLGSNLLTKHTDLNLLEQMVQKDEEGEVVQAARDRIQALTVTHKA
jgi:hypothetical protein